MTGSNKVLLVLGRTTSAHREDWTDSINLQKQYAYFHMVYEKAYKVLISNPHLKCNSCAHKLFLTDSMKTICLPHKRRGGDIIWLKHMNIESFFFLFLLVFIIIPMILNIENLKFEGYNPSLCNYYFVHTLSFHVSTYNLLGVWTILTVIHGEESIHIHQTNVSPILQTIKSSSYQIYVLMANCVHFKGEILKIE